MEPRPSGAVSFGIASQPKFCDELGWQKEFFEPSSRRGAMLVNATAGGKPILGPVSSGKCVMQEKPTLLYIEREGAGGKPRSV